MKILLAETEDFCPHVRAELESWGEVSDNFDGAIGEAEVLWIRLGRYIGAEVFDRAPGLRVVVSPTTGLNHIDLEEAARRGITVLSLKGEVAFLRRIRATVEHTLALTLGLLRFLPTSHADVLAGNWDRDRFRGQEISESTVGLIGCGRLGSLVAELFVAFGARVLVHDPFVAAEALPAGVEAVSLDDLLEASRIVSIHVDWRPENEGMIDAGVLAQMRPGAFLVNTARGELVDEGALLDALASGRLGGVALDVVPDEQRSGGPSEALLDAVRAHPRSILTPHTGGCTYESMHRTEAFMLTKLKAWSEQKNS